MNCNEKECSSFTRSHFFQLPIEILGTNHISAESVKEIQEANDRFKPDVIAVELEQPKHYDVNGIECAVEQAYGEPVDIDIIHKEWLFFADETGITTDQTKDGRQGGQLLVVEKGQPAAKVGAKKEGISEREIQEQIKSTLAKLSGNNMQEIAVIASTHISNLLMIYM